MTASTPRTRHGTTVALCAGLAGFGLVLMWVAHALAFLGPATRIEGGWLPYWWSYLLLYPLATGVASACMPRQWAPMALSLCAAPVLYYLALGAFAGDWRTSSAAWLGSLVALALSMLAGYLVSLWRGSRSRARHAAGSDR